MPVWPDARSRLILKSWKPEDLPLALSWKIFLFLKCFDQSDSDADPLSVNIGRGCESGGDRKPDSDRRADSQLALDGDFATVLFHDRIADTQSQAHAPRFKPLA